MSQYRAEAARLRLLRANPELVSTAVVDVLKATSVEALRSEPAKVDPLVMEILKELRRLTVAIEDQADPIINVSPAAVNVSPVMPSPNVNVSPQVSVTAPTDWYAIPEYHAYGQFQGKIKQVRFLAAQP